MGTRCGDPGPGGYGLSRVAGMLRGLGDTKVFTRANVINLGLRVGLAHLLAPTFGVAATWWLVPLGWFVNFAISHSGVVAWRRGREDFSLLRSPLDR